MKTIKGIFAVTLLTALLLTLFTCPFTAASAEGKAVTVRFDVAFDENAYLSRYDVDLYLDSFNGKCLATLTHGKGASVRVEGIAPGEHQLIFCRHNARSVSGKLTFTTYDDSVIKCRIHAYNDSIAVEDIRMFGLISPDEMLSASLSPAVSSPCTFEYEITFAKNNYFSKYDVEMEIDGVPVATLVQGYITSGTVVLPSAGVHTITFYESGARSVRRVFNLYVADETTYFKCHISAASDSIGLSGIVTNAGEY